MAGFGSLFETVVSLGVEIGGGGIIHGGKGVLVAGARKIGWASGGSSRQGRRFAGHSIARKSMGSGVSRVQRGSLGNYNPAQDYKNATLNPYRQAMKCGSGVVRSSGPGRSMPNHLFGRGSFEQPYSSLGRNTGQRYIKQSGAKSSSWAKNPRAHINFGAKRR